jgi:NF-kappa-B-activating protein
VMKKARLQPANEYWNKKILEVEEKDPNRWKHTGFKKMYVNGVRKSRSRSPRKAPLSPRARPPQSPVRRRVSRTPERYKPRSPPPRYARELPKAKEVYRTSKNRPISPPPKVRRRNASRLSRLTQSFLSRLLAPLQSQAAQMTRVRFAAATMADESTSVKSFPIDMDQQIASLKIAFHRRKVK